MTSLADRLRETAAGLEQAAGFIAQATRALFELFPELDNDDPAPREAFTMRAALAEAGGYVGDAIEELERYAREDEERPDPDEVAEEIAAAVVDVAKERIGAVTARAGRSDIADPPPQHEVAAELARGGEISFEDASPYSPRNAKR